MSSQDAINFFQRLGHLWVADRLRQTERFEANWVNRFCALMPRGGEVLDLGCGAGEPMATDVIARGFGVTGVDSAPEMIARCQKLHPVQLWLVGDMRELALDRQFSGVLAWDSFFHLGCDDQRAMFARFASHAAPGAPLMFTAGPQEGEAMGRLYGADLYHASLDPQEYRRLLQANGFDLVRYIPADPDCGGRWVWLAQRR